MPGEEVFLNLPSGWTSPSSYAVSFWGWGSYGFWICAPQWNRSRSGGGGHLWHLLMLRSLPACVAHVLVSKRAGRYNLFCLILVLVYGRTQLYLWCCFPHKSQFNSCWTTRISSRQELEEKYQTTVKSPVRKRENRNGLNICSGHKFVDATSGFQDSQIVMWDLQKNHPWKGLLKCRAYWTLWKGWN